MQLPSGRTKDPLPDCQRFYLHMSLNISCLRLLTIITLLPSSEHADFDPLINMFERVARAIASLVTAHAESALADIPLDRFEDFFLIFQANRWSSLAEPPGQPNFYAMISLKLV